RGRRRAGSRGAGGPGDGPCLRAVTRHAPAAVPRPGDAARSVAAAAGRADDRSGRRRPGRAAIGADGQRHRARRDARAGLVRGRRRAVGAARGRTGGGLSRRALAALVRKDLLLELRGREVVPAMVVFVVAAFVLFRFALGGDRAATGMLWVAVVFTAMLGLGRAFAQEREHRIWDGLLSSPVDRGLIWLAKACSTL